MNLNSGQKTTKQLLSCFFRITNRPAKVSTSAPGGFAKCPGRTFTCASLSESNRTSDLICKGSRDPGPKQSPIRPLSRPNQSSRSSPPLARDRRSGQSCCQIQRREMSTKDTHEAGTSTSAEGSRGPRPQFAVSPVPANPLGEGGSIRTAAALIIGDEILNGKTQDTNSHAFAQYCFQYGIDLKRIEVVADDEDEIVEAARRLCSKFDLVVTSGGIGPTHDDITYESLAKAFNTTVTHHEETITRMTAMNKWRRGMAPQSEEQRAASYRMALFPATAEVIFVDPEIWVPVIRLGGKLCVFPGIPALFQKMLHALTNFIPLPPPNERPLRIQIFTERPESSIAPYLTDLQKRLKVHGVQVGSYPILYKGVFVSLIGRELPPSPVGTPVSSNKSLPDSEHPSSASYVGPMGSTRRWLAEVAKEVENVIQGRVFTEEEVAREKEANANWNVRAGGKPSGQMEDLPKESTEELKEVKSSL